MAACPWPSSASFSLEFSDGATFEASPGSYGPEFALFDRVVQKNWETHWRRCVAGLVGFILLAFFSYWKVLPILANWIAQQMPASFEQQVSRDFTKFTARMSRAAKPELEDKLYTAGIAAQNLYPDLHLNFAICCSVIEIENAFALPGGKIYATEALVSELTPDELRAVLFHEVGHVYNHHPMRVLIENSLFSATLMMAAGYGDAYGWGATLMALSHSREFEREADIFAGQALQRMGKSPALLAQALDKIESGPRSSIAQMGWLSTHPVTSERKRYLNSL